MNETSSPPAKILLVEDDACTGLLLKNMLQREGYQIEHCSDGQAALDTLGKSRFDAVILDLMMPRVDGIQVLKGMRASPEHVYTPVIITTAARLKLVEDEAVRYGVKLYLDKTQTTKLLSGLREILAERAGAAAPAKLRMASPAPLQTKAPSSVPSLSEVEKPAEASEATKGFGRFFRPKGT